MELNIFEEPYYIRIDDALQNVKNYIIDAIEDLGNGADFGLAIGMARSILVKELRGKIDSNFDSEKLTFKVVYEFMIQNGYLPKEEINKFKTDIIIVLSGCASDHDENKDNFGGVEVHNENQDSYRIKGHSLAEIKVSSSMTKFQLNKSREMLEIRTLPDAFWIKYRTLLQIENKGSLKNETITKYSARLDEETEEIISLQGMKFHNYNKFSSHGRNYSLLRIMTSNKFLQSLVQSAEFHKVTEKDIDTLKYWLSFQLLGKGTKEECLKAYDGRKIAPAVKRLSKKISTIKELAKVVRMTEAYSLIKQGVGTPTKFLPDFDGVSLGATTLANQLRQEPMMRVCNLIDKDVCWDNHTNLLDSARRIVKDDAKLIDRFNSMTRNHAKPVNTVFIHGGMIQTCARSFGIKLELMAEIMAEHVGKDAYLVPRLVSDFGKAIHAKGNSIIQFPRPYGNGMVQSVGYSKRTMINLECDGYEYTVYADMPIIVGLPNSHIAHGGKSRNLPKEMKVSGLMAIITHVLDNAYLERLYEKRLIKYDTFDCYYSWNQEEVLECVTETFEETKNYLRDTLTYLEKYGVEKPNIKFGTTEITASNFVAP